VCSCPSSFSDTRRPRYYWINWQIWGNENAHICEEPERTLLQLSGCQPAWSTRLDRDTHRPSEFNTPFLTFVQCIKRSKPPHMPAGASSCSKIALGRWESDAYRYPPYQYEDRNGVIQKGTWRPLNSRERSVRLGFDWAHCEPAFTKQQRRSDPRGFEDLACSLLGNSFCCPMIGWLLGQKLYDLGILNSLPSITQCWGEQIESERSSGSDSSVSKSPTSSSATHVSAIRLLHRNVMYRGSDVRVATQTLAHPGVFPRKALDASRWKWRVVLAFPLSNEHINVLELRAIHAALKWRLRKSASVGRRFTHCVDSQVCMAVCCKGRSSSRILRRVLHVLNSLSLASSTHTVYAYVRSAENPADRPSRWRSFSFGKRNF